MATKVWYVNRTGQQVDPAALVVGGIATEAIHELVLPAGTAYATTRLWAGQGTQVSSARVAEAVAAASTDPLPASRPAAAPAGAADSLNPLRLEGVPLWVYGSSFTVDPGFACTPGMEFFKLAAARLGTTVTTYGVSGKSIRDAAKRIVGGLGVAGAPWLPTRRGIGVIDTWVNDLSAYGVGPVPRAYVAKDLTGIKANLRAALAMMSAQTIYENTAGVKSGTWAADGAANDRSGGSNSVTSTPGAYMEWTGVEVGSDGYFFYLAHTLEPTAFALAAVDVFVDGVKARTITAAEFQGHQSVEGGTVTTGNAAFKITAAPGTRTVRVQHAGAAATNMLVDALVVPRPVAKRSPVFVIRDAMPRAVSGGAFYKTAGHIATLAANEPQLLAAYKETLALFPNAVLVDSTLVAATDYGADGLHPNDRGMQRKADELVAAIRDRLAVSRPDNLYAVV